MSDELEDVCRGLCRFWLDFECTCAKQERLQTFVPTEFSYRVYARIYNINACYID